MKVKKILIGIFITYFFLGTSPVFAAELFLRAPATQVGLGQTMEVGVRINSEGETVNAFEGIIKIPESVSIKEIRDGDSIVAFWAERPIASDDNTVTFAGIVPGGWEGANGPLFSFVVETIEESTGTLSFSNIRVLLHDGKGTKTTSYSNTLTLAIDEDTPIVDLVPLIDDEVPPEPFTIYLAQDQDIFDGDYFLVFGAQDKDSGVDHYEVFESATQIEDFSEVSWKLVKSPYRIKDQTLQRSIYIRAIDRIGNVRIELFEPSLFDVRVTPTKGKVQFVSIMFAILLGIILLVIVAIGRFPWMSKDKKE